MILTKRVTTIHIKRYLFQNEKESNSSLSESTIR